jgi:hypothetical protein
VPPCTSVVELVWNFAVQMSLGVAAGLAAVLVVFEAVTWAGAVVSSPST